LYQIVIKKCFCFICLKVAALVWLKDNIGSFGGDSNRITLSGHGTGAALVNLLMISPLAAGEFDSIQSIWSTIQ
jgi:neuroligin